MMLSMKTEANAPPKDGSFGDNEAHNTESRLKGAGIVFNHGIPSSSPKPPEYDHDDDSIAIRRLLGYLALEVNGPPSNNNDEEHICIDDIEPTPIRKEADPHECQAIKKKRKSIDNVIIDMSMLLHDDFLQHGMPIMINAKSNDITFDDEEDPYAPRPILEKDNSIYFMDLKQPSYAMPGNCCDSTITSVHDHHSLTQEEEHLIELSADHFQTCNQGPKSLPTSKRHCSRIRCGTTNSVGHDSDNPDHLQSSASPDAAGLVTPYDSCSTCFIENDLSFDVTDLTERLASRMRESGASMSLLQQWDRENGLPKSHCQTMVNTSRSRTQLLEGVVVKKWNGKPLMEFEGAEKLVRRRSSCRRGRAQSTDGTSSRTTTFDFNQAKRLIRSNYDPGTDTASESENQDEFGTFVQKFTTQRRSSV
jgi:hypothetical protein